MSTSFCDWYAYSELRIVRIVHRYVFVSERIRMADIVSDEKNELTVPRFTIDGEITRQNRRFNAVGTELSYVSYLQQ